MHPITQPPDHLEQDVEQVLPGIQAAPSSSIAQACRRFGDSYPPTVSHLRLRVAGVLAVATQAVFLGWLALKANYDAPWVAWPFIAASMLSVAMLLLTVILTWRSSVPTPKLLPRGVEPHVAIIIPTCGESIPMILRTITSVTDQDWPADRRTIIVSDDAHDGVLEAVLANYPVIYHSPPPRFSPGRDGAAKAGNLNSVVALIDAEFPTVEFIETRDADDEVGSNNFLRRVLGQLAGDPRLAYVQTIKEAQVSAGDPFNNRESMFYRNHLLAKNAANAVFPCGSGVVWRRTALTDIGNFPTWNLVEDLQSGVEALRRGWHSMYLPIVGAVGQHSPEDVPNVYKQRGTWAVDTVRLMIWRAHRGLSLRQRAHFTALLMSYLISFATLTYIGCIISSFLGTSPVNDRSLIAIAYIAPFAVANQLYLMAANTPFNDRRGTQRRPLASVWRLQVLWTGMAPVYAKATLLAVFGGPHTKPVYKVTRKEHDIRWHWRATLPQMTLIAGLIGAAVYSVIERTMRNPGQIAITSYFGVFYLCLLAGFVNRGRHGLDALRSSFVSTATDTSGLDVDPVPVPVHA